MPFLATRLALLPLVLVFLFYPLIAWLVLERGRAKKRTWPFALVNIVGGYAACVATVAVHVTPERSSELRSLSIVGIAFLCYLALVAVNYALVRRNRNSSAGSGALVFAFPIVTLILIKYVPQVQDSFPDILSQISVTHVSVLFVGLSYVTFRLIQLAQEVRNEVVEMPTLIDYLGFAFFVPTLSIGPISPYSTYIQSVRTPDRERTPVLRSMLRIVVGLTKYIFLATLVSQLTYAGLLFDGHPHPKIDLVVSVFAYTVYLYLNFSGFCDMVIGISGLLGIEIAENFNQPFHARNLQEFWSRWHITLSNWLRDMMFTPMVKGLVRLFGPSSGNNMIAITIVVVFLVIGIWHGVGVNFALFGLSQGLGLAVVHYYTIFLKKWLGKKRFAAYRANRWIAAAGTTITIVYFSVSLFFFANSWANMHRIFEIIG